MEVFVGLILGNYVEEQFIDYGGFNLFVFIVASLRDAAWLHLDYHRTAPYGLYGVIHISPRRGDL